MTEPERDLVIVARGDSVGAEEYPLGPFASFDECTIGRSQDARVFINHESVSRRHCRLFRQDGQVLVENLSERSKTYIDGRAITEPTALSAGQMLGLGDITIEIKGLAVSAPKVVQARPPRAGQSILHRGGGVQAKIVGGGARRSAPAETVITGGSSDRGSRATAEIDLEIDLETKGKAKSEIVIGRSAEECDIVLADEPLVSRRHAKFVRTRSGWAIEDLRSGNGTFVAGHLARGRSPLEDGDVVAIGPIQLVFEAGRLFTRRRQHPLLIDVRDVAVPGHRGLALNKVTFGVRPGELVGVLGISGSGKTRLMHAMSGRAPLAAGQVLYGGQDFHANIDSLRQSIGYVPSWLTVHDALTVQQGLAYVSRLRLARDLSGDEIHANIDRVLQTVKMQTHAGAQIRRLSDGQKRRVGLSVELLSDAPILFLDEVTTALDLPTHCQFMRLFRTLADCGKTLLLISHHLEDLELCDRWLYLVQGRVAFFGGPKEFNEHFKVNSLRAQLQEQERLREAKDGEAWAAEFERSARRSRREEAAPQAEAERTAVAATPAQRWREIRRQTVICTRRYASLLGSDVRSLGVMLGLGPVIAALIVLLNMAIDHQVDEARKAFDASKGAVTGAGLIRTLHMQDQVLAFMLVMSVIIVCTFMSVREIVKEKDLLRHERFAGLDVVAYFASKATPLCALGVISAVAITMILRALVGDAALQCELPPLLATVSVTAIAAVLLGLLISAAVESSETAFLMLAPVVILQFCLGGGLITVEGSKVEPLSRWVVLAYWADQGVVDLLGARTTGDAAIDTQVKAQMGSLELTGTPWPRALLFVAGHAVAYSIATYAMLVRKDGPPLLTRLRRDIVSLVPGLGGR